MNGDIAEVVTAAGEFKEELRLLKRQLGRAGFEWYPYDTFTSLPHLDRLLTGSNRQLFAGKRLRILDVGCQDGDLSFLLERLGHEVVSIDHHLYNHNGMRGVRALRQALGSSIQLHEIDVDRQFTLPHDTYDLVIMLGVLYHLRNPFYALEELARRATRGLISTRIARRFPGGAEMPKDLALAYLLGEKELNDDETNYFIFSEPALRVMLERTHWEICDYLTVGKTEDSEPVRLDRDERAFCLLKSRYDRLADIELLQGWHASEETGWRWTAKEFAARLRWSGVVPPRTLTVRLFLSEGLMRQVHTLEISLAINGRSGAKESFRESGKQTLIRKLPPDLGPDLLLNFALNGALPPDECDRRERGVIVESIVVE